ncbi:Domain of unknown function (DUF4214)/Hemolysin-type calcium-binding repeat (2 copies) [Gulbenkiania indica]|uniref:DUF4214 domain-containing protein n=1 Tax=Gulbenkiania indica TaxID=375574 RepID=A0A0K6GX56_9NEIS|nr:DUF4214 domain-containing protein [Gulbenkiania indica]CUA83326.1 Domain of unknown function (DUF4214)/Hemolysin-type calcium-binding repeat (2 copies) [Gulbenkiania indica]
MAASAYYDTVQKLYIAYYGRPADPLGLEFWASKVDAAGGNTEEIVNAFGTSEEAQSIYGNLGVAAAINSIYQNIFGRDADTTGLTYYATEVNAGRLSLASLAQAIINGAQNEDATVVANKLEVAKQFTGALDTAAEIVSYNGQAAAKMAHDLLDGVTADPASVTDATGQIDSTIEDMAGAQTGNAINLTSGVDTITGTAGNDIINALPINASNGAAATTLSAFDTIDGGAGNDTLNIYTEDGNNGALAASATIKNVENVNIYNSETVFNTGTAGVVDAARFVGVTALNQNNAAANVINLAATTTAGFNNISSGSLQVTAAAAATSANVNLKNVDEGVTLAVRAGATGTLNTVNVTGNVVDGDDAGTDTSPLTLTVVAGRDVQSVAINTNLDTRLFSVSNAGGKALNAVDASGSTGDIRYVAAAAVGSIKTGTGDDVVTLRTAFSASQKAASVSTGEGNDVITVSVDNTGNNDAALTTGATASVDAGAGNDRIALNIDANVAYNVKAGAGDDIVSLETGTIKTTDLIDGGDGNDTIALAGQGRYVADDYIVLNKLIKNFEVLNFTSEAGATTAIDGSQIGMFKTISFDEGGRIAQVAADQSLVTAGDLTASAAGYTAASTGKATVYGGDLKVSVSGGQAAVIDDPDTGDQDEAQPQQNVAVTAYASNLALDVKATTTDSFASLTGDVKSATVTLTNAVDNAAAPTADTVAHFSLNTAATANAGAYTALGGLTSLTLKGNGSATIVNGANTALTLVDASQLGGTATVGASQGSALDGLDYTTNNQAAETIKLGSGLDSLTFSAGSSVYGKVDTVMGLNLVLNAEGTGLDAAKSDTIRVGEGGSFAKFTTTQVDLDLALKEAAAFTADGNAQDNVVFQLGGDTYIYQDAAGSNNGLIDAGDTLIKLAGTVDLDTLVVALQA